MKIIFNIKNNTIVHTPKREQRIKVFNIADMLSYKHGESGFFINSWHGKSTCLRFTPYNKLKIGTKPFYKQDEKFKHLNILHFNQFMKKIQKANSIY